MMQSRWLRSSVYIRYIKKRRFFDLYRNEFVTYIYIGTYSLSLSLSLSFWSLSKVYYIYFTFSPPLILLSRARDVYRVILYLGIYFIYLLYMYIFHYRGPAREGWWPTTAEPWCGGVVARCVRKTTVHGWVAVPTPHSPGIGSSQVGTDAPRLLRIELCRLICWNNPTHIYIYIAHRHVHLHGYGGGGGGGGGCLSGFCCSDTIYRYIPTAPPRSLCPRRHDATTAASVPAAVQTRFLIPAVATAAVAWLKGSGKRPRPLGGLLRRDKKLISMTAVKNTPDRHLTVYIYFHSPSRLTHSLCFYINSHAHTHTHTHSLIIYISRVSRWISTATADHYYYISLSHTTAERERENSVRLYRRFTSPFLSGLMVLYTRPKW